MNFSAKFKSLNDKINVPDYRKKFFFSPKFSVSTLYSFNEKPMENKKSWLKKYFSSLPFSVYPVFIFKKDFAIVPQFPS